MQILRSLLYRYAKAGWRYRWGALALTWLICGVGWAAVMVMPNSYESSARLYVDTDAILTPLLRGIAVDSAPAGQIEVFEKTLLSTPNLEKLISKTGLDLRTNGPGAREQLVQALAGQIKILPQSNKLFTIAYRDKSPQVAYDVVQTLITLFIETATGSNRSEMDNAQQFLQQQIDLYERKLREAEQRRAEFRSKYLDLLPSDANGGLSGLEVARTNVRNLSGELLDAQSKQAMLAQELTNTPPLLTPAMVAAGMGGGRASSPRLAEAEAKLEELRLKYTDQYPEVIATRRLVEALRSGGSADAPRSADPQGAHMASGGRSVPNPVYQQLRVLLVEVQTSVASLRRQVDEAVREKDRLEAIARSEPEVQAEFLNLDRDYSVLQKNYEELLTRRESAKIAAAAETEADKIKLQIIDPPHVPRNPVAPKRLLLMFGTLVAGIASGIGVAFLMGQMERSFYTIEELRGLGMPVIGSISFILPTAGKVNRQRLVAFRFSAAVALLGIIFVGLVFSVLKFPHII